jgi:hypothetical protein
MAPELATQCLAFVEVTFLGESAAECCTRAINLTAAFTTHFPEGLRAISSEEIFLQHICLVFVA